MALPTDRRDDSADNRQFINTEHLHPTHTWRNCTPLDNDVTPYRRAEHTAVVYKNEMYVYGGRDVNEKERWDPHELFRYNPRTGLWSLPEMYYWRRNEDETSHGWYKKKITFNERHTFKRYGHSAVVYKTSMFVFGGVARFKKGDVICNPITNDLYEYDFEECLLTRWNYNCVRGPEPRCYHAAAVYKKMMFIFGGFSDWYYLNDMWMIPLDRDLLEPGECPSASWIEVRHSGDIPSGYYFTSFAQTDDFLYMYNTKEDCQLLYKFHFKTKTWKIVTKNNLLDRDQRKIGQLPGGRMVSYGKFLYVMASKLPEAKLLEGLVLTMNVYRIDTETDEWEMVCKMEDGNVVIQSFFNSAVVIGCFMYVFGGTFNGYESNKDLLRFKLSDVRGSSIVREFRRLLDSEQLTDVVLTITKAEDDTSECVNARNLNIPAHSVILAARSPYLKKKIEEAKKKEKKSRLKFGANHLTIVGLDDISPLFLEMIVEFIYTDRIEFNPRTGVEKLSHLSIIEDLCTVARRFQIVLLHRLCLHILKFGLKYRDTTFVPPSKRKEEESETDREIRNIWSHSLEKAEKELKKISLGHSLCGDLENCRKMKILCDFHISVGFSRKQIHKLLFAARSDYFNVLFRHTTRNETVFKLELDVMDPPATAMKSFVKFIYTDNCPNLTVTDAIYLFNACNFFLLRNTRLQGLCKELLETSINDDNVFDIIEISTKNNQKNIRYFALLYAAHHRDRIVRKSRFAKLDRKAKRVIRWNKALQFPIRINTSYPFVTNNYDEYS